MVRNATLIDADLARRIAAARFRRVSVSMDGADAATHDALRGEGNFSRALAGVNHLRAAGVKVQFNVTVTRANANQLDALAALAREQQAEAMHLALEFTDPRAVFDLHRLKPDPNTARILRSGRYVTSIDRSFERVVRA